MIADIHRMENAARLAMGSFQEPEDLSAGRRGPASMVPSIVAALAAIALVSGVVYALSA